MEGEVRRAGRFGSGATEGAGEREQPAETDAGGSHARQCRVEGSTGKKVVKPAARREAATYLRQAFQMSERRACWVIGTDRASMRYRAFGRTMGRYASG